ncbi:hypothetical protein K443DRAFT_117778 [Laccaria amethystina LaAM-08-1]|uniref:Secreted protein n=1 Tax=Laccaria amethystina LaAM-08-1 TaxID=1095629 RepID=A0A0C9WYT6_9AGAR|nr:hypothetical protein K443DRAFT_117778 [Laccaria amethystina LaAM-08-1]
MCAFLLILLVLPPIDDRHSHTFCNLRVAFPSACPASFSSAPVASPSISQTISALSFSQRLRLWEWRFMETAAANVAANLKSGGHSLL